ncbi:MAG TPA: hypothetical protein VFQ21_09190 [Gemmatimonadota bacterium]|nr:hypothetical protein [Gemmatimonadota bacterium]
MTARVLRSRLARVVMVAAVVAGTGCGDLLQEPDTGFSKLTLRLEEVSGNDQTGPTGSALAQPVRVRILGAEEAPIARLRIEWLVIGGSGTAEPRDTFSDENGVAETFWILGSESGQQKLQAIVRDGVFVDFQATAVAP